MSFHLRYDTLYQFTHALHSVVSGSNFQSTFTYFTYYSHIFFDPQDFSDRLKMLYFWWKSSNEITPNYIMSSKFREWCKIVCTIAQVQCVKIVRFCTFVSNILMVIVLTKEQLYLMILINLSSWIVRKNRSKDIIISVESKCLVLNEHHGRPRSDLAIYCLNIELTIFFHTLFQILPQTT